MTHKRIWNSISEVSAKRTTAEETQSFIAFRDNVIGFRYLLDCSAFLRPSLLETSIKINVDEFGPFLRKFAAARYFMEVPDDDGLTPMGSTSHGLVALAERRGRGLLLWLPLRQPTDSDDLLAAVKSIARCTFTYLSRRRAEEPEWVGEQFTWIGEAEVRDREQAARSTLQELELTLERFARLRRILWARDETLRLAVTDFLRTLGMEVADEERYGADFWLLDGGAEQVIGEVKAFNSNLTPSELARIVSHRKYAAKGDEFPGMIVVHTFANEESIEKKRIEPNVCRRAREDNVLVLRTIDLARYYDGLTRAVAGFELAKLWEYLRSGGGWLEATAGELKLHTG